MTLRASPLVLAAGFSLALFARHGAALAQSPEAKAAAAVLFEEGRKLKDEGKLAAACPKLEESQRLDPGIGTLYHLSDCHERSGRTASAWVGFRETAAMALSANRPEQEKVARGRAAALEPKLIRLNIVVRPEAGNVEVKRDGSVVSPALWGTAVPLDPGKHQVSATAPGKEPWETTVTLDQPGETVKVEVPPLAPKRPGGPAVVPPAGGAPAPPPGDGSAPPPPPPDAGSPRPWQTPLGIVLTGVGAVGLGLGTAFGFMAKSTYDDSNAGGHCNAGNKCDQTGLDLRDSAVQKGNVGTGVFIAGAALAAAGIIVWVTAPSKPKSARVAPPRVGVGPTGLALQGAW